RQHLHGPPPCCPLRIGAWVTPRSGPCLVHDVMALTLGGSVRTRPGTAAGLWTTGHEQCSTGRQVDLLQARRSNGVLSAWAQSSSGGRRLIAGIFGGRLSEDVSSKSSTSPSTLSFAPVSPTPGDRKS